MACCPPLPSTGLLPSDCGPEPPSDFWDVIPRRTLMLSAFRRAARAIECVPFGHSLRSEFTIWWQVMAPQCPEADASETLLLLWTRKFNEIAERAEAGWPTCDRGSIVADVAAAVEDLPATIAAGVTDLAAAAGAATSIPTWVFIILAAVGVLLVLGFVAVALLR